MNPQFSNNPTLLADSPVGRRTFFWFRIYSALMTLIYVLVAALGVFLVIAQPKNRQYEGTEILVVGAAYSIIGLVLLVLFGIGLFLPRQRWAWIYGIVLIAIGMTSCCFLPITIPLLIFWLKPETKAIFGR